MGLKGKLTAQIEMKAGGDLFHELVRYEPQQIPNISPTTIQGCDLHEGDWGNVGSVYFWKYTLDGKQGVAKDVIESIDEEKKSMTFKVIEGDLMKLYKAFKVGFHVDTHGGIDLVTWTLEYEKLNDDVEEPLSMLGFCIKLAKDVEAHHLKAT
ncbi:kirola-like [Olea europaea subsp. europaea]|uniref:Kirola-like n=1 Tax=Olea europaea subsp. europaea TaxID=158383 RepID=A0A8S0VAA2_OLEEU|nr:kirola-like [Olea europaea subsp. europaea]